MWMSEPTSTFNFNNKLRFAPIWHLKSLSICRKKEICPYELIKSALSDARVVALSYLYVFDPVIRNAFLKNMETELQKIILIVDEAHNLPETAIDISGSSLSLFVMRQAELEANRFGNKDIEAFAQFFRTEVEKLTDHVYQRRNNFA
jgi:DNA excision repair protein ERCC-2